MGLTLFSALSGLSGSELPASLWRRAPLLYLEGAAFCAISMSISSTLGIGQSGFVSVFLASAALAHRFDDLLHENRGNVWERRMTGWQANRLTALSVLALFLGVLSAYIGAELWFDESTLLDRFDFVLRAAHLGQDTILTRRFSSLLPLLFHNYLVLLAFIILGFVYRSYGALLALCWNACLWGIVLTALVRRGMAQSGGSPLRLAALSMLALLPHLMLEALAQVIASLGAIFLSKGVFTYDLTDPRLRQVSAASLQLVLLAGGLILMAGLAEARVAPALLAFIG